MPSPSRPVSVELLTAADAERRQRRAAAALLAKGLAAGDRVAFAPGPPPLRRAAAHRPRYVRHHLVRVAPFARFEYWDNEEATRAAWRGDACTVGDLGTLDRHGNLFLTGRRHDLVIRGGNNVYPVEAENVLAAVPGVREVAVFGLSDAQWVQRVCAAFVADASVGEESLRAAASAHLAPYKRPKSYFPATDLPRTVTGKLVRRDVAGHLGLAGG
ncbi:MAG TPA: hypothetical protein VIX84_11885 [Acidimicrobiales bacterium]